MLLNCALLNFYTVQGRRWWKIFVEMCATQKYIYLPLHFYKDRKKKSKNQMEKLFLLFLALNGREIIKYTWHLFRANAEQEATHQNEERKFYYIHLVSQHKKEELNYKKFKARCWKP